VDAWAIVDPRRAFEYLATQPRAGGVWIAVRRPLLVAVALGSTMSMLASGVLTARIALSATTYWTFVPIAEALALLAVAGRRLERGSRSAAIDTFFAGHGPWTLFMIAVTGVLTFVSPALWWTLLTGALIVGMAVVMLWSAYIDFWFFRTVLRASRAGAVRDVIVNRLLTWTAVFLIFAVETWTPGALVRELTEAFKEM
jgi:hypothetical protein